MTEISNDIVAPSMLIVREVNKTSDLYTLNQSGAILFMSGGKLHFTNAAGTQVVTSA